MTLSRQILIGTVLHICADVSGIAAVLTGPRAAEDFTIEKVSSVPAMTIRSMVQTRDGYLWFGSYDGLYRFDGVRMLAFKVGNTPSLSSESIRVLCEDRSANLWIGTDDGGGLMRYRNGEFSSFNAKQGPAGIEVRSICEDHDGTVWVGTQHGLFFLKNERLVALPATNVLTAPIIHSLASAPNGELWIGTSRGLFRWDVGRGNPGAVMSPGNVQGLARASNGVLWGMVDSRSNIRISTQDSQPLVERLPIAYAWFQPGASGALWLAGTKGTLFHLGEGNSTNVTMVAEFDRPQITSICEDADGNIWVGIESHGLYRLRRKQVVTLSGRNGIGTESVTTILQDSAGHLWLGTFGNGLLVMTNESLPFQARRVPDVFNITALREARDGTLWFGTYGGDQYYSTGSKFVAVKTASPGCRAIFEDRAGGLWIATLRNGVERREEGRRQKFTMREGLSSDQVTCLAQDSGGDMWIGTYRGLNRLSEGKVSRFAGDEALRNLSILGLYVDKAGDLWIATGGGGLMRYREEQMRTITSRNGLPTDLIVDVLEDDQGRMWLATAEGIACVARAELEACADGRANLVQCITLGTEDGMVLAQCNTGFKPSCTKSGSGLLWFCTAGGLVNVDPTTIKARAKPPPVYIEEVIADDEPVPLKRSSETGLLTAVIPPRATRVGFRYTALSLAAPEKTQFRYWLEGYDEDWVNARNARSGYYTRLPPGAYRFRVGASSKDGVSNEAAEALALVVLPSWWQTRWFQGVALVAFAGLIFGLYEWRVHQLRLAKSAQETFSRRLIESQEQERKRVAAELHDSLGQSLQIIKGRAELALSRGGEASEKNKQFEEISETATQAIREVRAISHALRPAELDQLGLTKAIEWMVQQAGATSKTRFDCELENVDALLPPETAISLYRIAQEGINNVLRHAMALEAIVELKREGNNVRFSLFDNGRGFAKLTLNDSTRERFGQGLAGIAERVKLFGGVFDIQSAPGRGTRLNVICKLPTSEL